MKKSFDDAEITNPDASPVLMLYVQNSRGALQPGIRELHVHPR